MLPLVCSYPTVHTLCHVPLTLDSSLCILKTVSCAPGTHKQKKKKKRLSPILFCKCKLFQNPIWFLILFLIFFYRFPQHSHYLHWFLCSVLKSMTLSPSQPPTSNARQRLTLQPGNDVLPIQGMAPDMKDNDHIWLMNHSADRHRERELRRGWGKEYTVYDTLVRTHCSTYTWSMITQGDRRNNHMHVRILIHGCMTTWHNWTKKKMEGNV